MTEKEKALELIKQLRKASYNHAHYGKDMAIDEETAIELVEEMFEVNTNMGMIKEYYADSEKSWKCGNDPRYTYIIVKDGVITGLAKGNNYQGCACKTDERPHNCTADRMNNCIEDIIRHLSDEDAAEVRKARLP